MAFINQGYHVGMVGRGGFEIEADSCLYYTSGGINYKVCTFLATGTFTVTSDGFMDYLCVSGGGGAGGRGGFPEGGMYGGGGGAGGGGRAAQR